MEEAKSTIESDGHSNYVISTEKWNIDQLEAKLEFELEQLQLELDREDSVMISEWGQIEVFFFSVNLFSLLGMLF